MAIRRNLSTPEARAFWKHAEEAAKEVAKWPAWKRGEKEPMKINGYKLREAIKAWETRKELAEQALNNALFVFPGDDATHLENNPVMYWEQLAEAEQAIVRLQTSQAQYNLKVSVQIGEYYAPLAYAIKYIGAIQRFVKLWKAMLQKGTIPEDRYSRQHAWIRKEDEVHANKTLSDEECRAHVLRYRKQENELRARIATANAEEVELEGLDENLFPPE